MTSTSRTPRARMATTMAVLALLVAGCGGGAGPSDAVAATPWSANCDPIEHPPVQVGGHLIGDAAPPADYSSIPPTSGWHSTDVPAAGEVHDGLTDPEIVAAIEVGTVVVAVAPDVDATAAADLVAQFPDRLLVTTYEPSMPTPVALVTWGSVVRCATLTTTDATSFVLTERVSPDGH